MPGTPHLPVVPPAQGVSQAPAAMRGGDAGKFRRADSRFQAEDHQPLAAC